MSRLALLVTALIPMTLIGAAAPPDAIRLYTLDCGRIDFTDMANFSDTGDHDGEHGAMPVPCFLIRDGRDWMLWDAGLGDEIAASAGGREVVGLHFRVPRTLASQLAELKLKPDDIRYVGLSHLHADHSGNAALFPHATFLVSPVELAWASAASTPEGVQPDRVAAVMRSRLEPVAADRDVFGDGTVRMMATPGHTVGHHSLMLHLRRAGWVILTGDVAHFQVNYDRDLVPLGNANRADTIASLERIKGLAAHYHARVVVQHAADIFENMPRLPAYLE
jgi:N-acyl homoserine lactone hydrolase